MDEISEKTQEAKKTDKANKDMAAENDIAEYDGSKKGEKAIAAVGYILYFCILPLVLKRKSKFCQYHGKQGLVLTTLFLFFHTLVFWNFTLNVIIGFTYLIGIIVGITYSIQGKIIKFPLIDKVVDQLDFD